MQRAANCGRQRLSPEDVWLEMRFIYHQAMKALTSARHLQARDLVKNISTLPGKS